MELFLQSTLTDPKGPPTQVALAKIKYFDALTWRSFLKEQTRIDTVDCMKSSMKETKGKSVSVSVPGCCLS